eukprot:scaffold107847_cov32-Tisochrysis_lutea.AAC.1
MPIAPTSSNERMYRETLSKYNSPRMEAIAVGSATRISVLMAWVVRISKRRRESRRRATPEYRLRAGADAARKA